MTAGRPTKYRPDFPKKAIAYFNKCLADATYPSIAGLAVSLGVHKAQVYEYEPLYPKFRDALCIGRDMGEQVLVDKALDESWNPGFAKFLAINNFGMLSEHAKAENTNTHEFPTGININFVGGQQ